MAKGTIKFDLPEEKREFDAAINAMELGFCLWDFDQYLRSRIKYEELNDDQYKALQDARDKLWELMDERGVARIVDA